MILEAGGRIKTKDFARWEQYLITNRLPYEVCRDLDYPQRDVSGENTSLGRTPVPLVGARLFVYGGSTMHWGGWSFRLKPEDFRLKSNTGENGDWPIHCCVRRPGVAMPLARRAASAAVKQNEKLARAHGLLGLISLIYDFDWMTAEEKLQEALKLDADEPGALLAYSHLLISSGRTTEGIERIDRAVHAVPTEPIITVSRGWLHVLAGDLTEGLSLCEKACEAYRKLGPAHVLLGFAHELNNRPKDAIASCRESLRIEPSAVGLGWLGHLYGKLGKKDLGIGTLKKIKEVRRARKIAYEPAYCKALVYAGLNRTQDAARQHKKARREHCDWLIHLDADPRWSPLKKEPIFEEVREEVGLRTHGREQSDEVRHNSGAI